MSIKLIVSDIDGTLQPYDSPISQRTKDAVRACAERGVEFCIATGRWYVTAMNVVEELGQTDATMIITNGGQVMKSDGTLLAEWGIPDEKAWQIYEIVRRHDVMLNAYTRGHLFRLNTPAYGRRAGELDSYLGGAFLVSADDRENFEKNGLKHPYKIEVYSHDKDKLAAIREELTAQGFCVTSSYHTNLEIVVPGMGKGTAVKWLANHMGLDHEECLAMGDNTNDLPMLEAVGWPVAMGNAVPELKAVARIVAPNDVDDGAAQIIERALEGKL